MCLFGFCAAAFFQLIELAFGGKSSVGSTVCGALAAVCCAFVCVYFVVGVTYAQSMRGYTVAGLAAGALCQRLLLRRPMLALALFSARAVRALARPLKKAAAYAAEAAKKRAELLRKKVLARKEALKKKRAETAALKLPKADPARPAAPQVTNSAVTRGGDESPHKRPSESRLAAGTRKRRRA